VVEEGPQEIDLSTGSLITDLKLNVNAALSRSISGCALDPTGKPFDTVELRFRQQVQGRLLHQ
jgi:hypothetical protein